MVFAALLASALASSHFFTLTPRRTRNSRATRAETQMVRQPGDLPPAFPGSRPTVARSCPVTPAVTDAGSLFPQASHHPATTSAGGRLTPQLGHLAALIDVSPQLIAFCPLGGPEVHG